METWIISLIVIGCLLIVIATGIIICCVFVVIRRRRLQREQEAIVPPQQIIEECPTRPGSSNGSGGSSSSARNDSDSNSVDGDDMETAKIIDETVFIEQRPLDGSQEDSASPLAPSPGGSYPYSPSVYLMSPDSAIREVFGSHRRAPFPTEHRRHRARRRHARQSVGNNRVTISATDASPITALGGYEQPSSDGDAYDRRAAVLPALSAGNNGLRPTAVSTPSVM